MGLDKVEINSNNGDFKFVKIILRSLQSKLVDELGLK